MEYKGIELTLSDGKKIQLAVEADQFERLKEMAGKYGTWTEIEITKGMFNNVIFTR